jgi:glycosyltransferase involved in cell wall biosynthesis
MFELVKNARANGVVLFDMRVLQVCQRYAPYVGGLEEHVRNISERLARTLDVSVATTDPSSKLPRRTSMNGVEILRFRSWAPHEAYFLSKDLQRFLRENSDCFDVVHAHCYHAFPALYAAQAKRNNKLVFTPHYHGGGHTFFRSMLHFPYKFLGRRIFDKADRIVCVSAYEKSLVLDKFEIDSGKVIVIPNGINKKEFETLNKNTNKQQKTVLYVGRLEKYKGIHYLIKALEYLDKDVDLEIVGKGPYESSLVNLASKLGLEDRVRFYRYLSRNELLAEYAAAGVFVLLSEHEAYGISVAEALASKTPCVVANNSALTEWIDNENCFGIDYPIQPKELAKVIGSTLGKKVRDVNLWDWEQVAQNLLEQYEDIQHSSNMRVNSVVNQT